LLVALVAPAAQREQALKQAQQAELQLGMVVVLNIQVVHLELLRLLVITLLLLAVVLPLEHLLVRFRLLGLQIMDRLLGVLERLRIVVQ
jgi:hypothetical protein